MRRSTRIPSAVGLAVLLTGGLLACDDSDNPLDNGDGNGNGGGTESRVVVLDGDIGGNRTLNADSVYVIAGFLEVQPGATLTVPAGTVLVSDIDTDGTIVTLRASGAQPSGRLVVQGTAAAPVVFRPGTEETAEQMALVPAQAISCSRGQGGGIVLHGDAPVNLVTGEGISEGVARPFGGDNPADDSGDIRHLVILCGGVPITPDNEINGLTMAGVGHGTTISFVQAHLIADDGFEWFGGTVNGDHLVSSANDDDAFDCDFGWNGTVQFGLAVQDRDLANRGMECDNDGNGSGNVPITQPKLWNFTWIGTGIDQASSEVNDGLFLRRNSAPKIFNTIVANFGNVGVVIDGGSSQAQAAAGELELNHILFHANRALLFPGAGAGCLTANVAFRNGGYTSDGVEDAFGGSTFVCADPLFTDVNLADPIDGQAPDPRPAAGSPALDEANAATPVGDVVDPGARYLGAFDSENWLAGWTLWNVNSN